MTRKIQKLLSMLTVTSMCAGLLSFPALAAETVSETTTNPDGTTVVITTTTEGKTDESGKPTVVVTIQKDTNDEIGRNVTVDGVTVTLDATRTEEYESNGTDENGAPVKGELQHYVDEGTETKEWTENDTGDAAGQPPVSVDLIPGKTTTGTATTTTITGEDTDKSDGEWDYTETTTTDRTVTAKTSEIETQVNDASTGLINNQGSELTGAKPVYDVIDGVTQDKYGVYDNNYLKDIEEILKEIGDPSTWETPEDDAVYRYVGTGEYSDYYIASAYVEYEKNEDGTVQFKDGKPVIKSIKSKKDGTVVTHKVTGEPLTELVDGDLFSTYQGTRYFNYALMDADGNIVGAYCCDLGVPNVAGEWYSVSNLEDSNHYATEEAEQHIRAIALNGYWGTSNIPQEDGSYNLGSLEYVKETLKDAIEKGEIAREYETYLYSECKTVCNGTCTKQCGKLQCDEDGNPIKTKIDMLSVIDGLTEGEAMLATQTAIWYYSDDHKTTDGSGNIIDGNVIVDISSRGNFKGNSTFNEPLDNNGNARVEFLFNWLIGLQAEKATDVVINEKNFVADMSLTVGDKAEGYAQNEDENADNDVYNTSLNFKLAFVPSAENDDLLVQLTYTDLDGEEQIVVKRLAGENSESQSFEKILPGEDGSYVISGLKLSENNDFEFDLRLEGTQYLEQGVYIYEPIGNPEDVQALIGIAEGERSVDVSASMTISFDVDEDDHISATRSWREEGPDRDSSDPPSNPPSNPPSDPPSNPPSNPPSIVIPDELVPLAPMPEPEVPLAPDSAPELEEILNEEVPLANVPKTGDASALWMVLSALSGAGLAGVSLLGRKKREEI